MTYLKKVQVTNDYICYAYGENQECLFGTIKINLNNIEDVTFTYSKSNNFNRLTSQALLTLAQFIRDSYYPNEYLRATH